MVSLLDPLIKSTYKFVKKLKNSIFLCYKHKRHKSALADRSEVKVTLLLIDKIIFLPNSFMIIIRKSHFFSCVPFEIRDDSLYNNKQKKS